VVTAIVLLKAEIHRIPEVAEAIAQLPAVSEVYSITGDYDLVAIVRVRAHDDLAEVIPGGLNKVDGVTATQTHVAFRAYSRHDLEAAFSIGLAELSALWCLKTRGPRRRGAGALSLTHAERAQCSLPEEIEAGSPPLSASRSVLPSTPCSVPTRAAP
jgi:uncharacterized protein with GYD domain